MQLGLCLLILPAPAARAAAHQLRNSLDLVAPCCSSFGWCCCSACQGLLLFSHSHPALAQRTGERASFPSFSTNSGEEMLSFSSSPPFARLCSHTMWWCREAQTAQQPSRGTQGMQTLQQPGRALPGFCREEGDKGSTQGCWGHSGTGKLQERGGRRSRFCPDMGEHLLSALLVITLTLSLHNQRFYSP